MAVFGAAFDALFVSVEMLGNVGAKMGNVGAKMGNVGAKMGNVGANLLFLYTMYITHPDFAA